MPRFQVIEDEYDIIGHITINGMEYPVTLDEMDYSNILVFKDKVYHVKDDGGGDGDLGFVDIPDSAISKVYGKKPL